MQLGLKRVRRKLLSMQNCVAIKDIHMDRIHQDIAIKME